MGDTNTQGHKHTGTETGRDTNTHGHIRTRTQITNTQGLRHPRGIFCVSDKKITLKHNDVHSESDADFINTNVQPSHTNKHRK